MKESTNIDEVFTGSESFVDRCILAGQTNTTANLIRSGNNVDSIDECCSGIGANKRGENFDLCGLAGTIRTKQSIDGSGRDGKVNAVQRNGVAKSLHHSSHLNCKMVCHRLSMPALEGDLDATASSVFEPRVLAKPNQLSRADWARTMFRHNDLCTCSVICVRVVHLIAIQKHDDVCVLFKRP